MTTLPRVTIWNEFRHEKMNEEIARIYPEGLHAALAKALKPKAWKYSWQL